MMEAYHLIYLKGLTVQLEYFNHFGACITHSCMPQKYKATTTIFISFCIKFKYYLSVIIGVALIQYEKCYIGCIAGLTPSLCVREYLQINFVSVWQYIPASTLPFALSSHLYSGKQSLL